MTSPKRTLALGSLGALLLVGSAFTLGQQTELPVKSMKLEDGKLVFEIDTKVPAYCTSCHSAKAAAPDPNIGMPPTLEGNIGMPPSDSYANEGGFTVVIKEGQIIQIARLDSPPEPIVSVSIDRGRALLLYIAAAPPPATSRKQLVLPDGLYVPMKPKSGVPHSFRVRGGAIVALGAGAAAEK